LDAEGAADGLILVSFAVLAFLCDGTKVLPFALFQVVAEEVSGGPRYAVDATARRIHVHGDDAFAVRLDREVFEAAGRQVEGKQMTTGIGLVTCGRDAHCLHAVDDAVVPDMRRKVELPIGLDEAYVALALRD